MNAAAETIEVAKEAVTAGSVINHLKNNRMEYLIGVGLLHLMGVSDAVVSRLAGVCF